MDQEMNDASVEMDEDVVSDMGELDNYCVDSQEDIGRIDFLSLTEDDGYSFTLVIFLQHMNFTTGMPA